MATIAESVGAAAASVVLSGAKVEGKAEKADKKNPILSALGRPAFLQGDGKTYPRTTGFGASRKPHPDGGTNETVAWVIFKPFERLDITMEGRIYCERFVEAGKRQRTYSISLPFLKAERRDVVGRQAIESTKLQVRDLYRMWAETDAKNLPTKAARLQSADRWTEDDEE